MNKPSMDVIERRAWQLCELFRAVDAVSSANDSVVVLATLGRALCKELSEYVNGERDQLIGASHE